MTWTKGRRLSSYTHNGTTYTFTYDGDGQRKTKSYGQTRHTYDYVEGRLVRERRYVNNALTMEVQYLYDSTGILGFVYNGMEFYYRKNVQGDVIGVMYGRYQMATYAYDAYGNCTIVNELQNVGKLNPFRFKGYYYDDETGLYYLMTRYYDPEIGRFVNADDVSYLSPETLNGLNLYAYCGNDPINYFDPDGTFSISAVVGSKIALAFLGILALFYIESQTHIIENFVENIVDMTQNLTQNITANDSSIATDSSISAIKTERKNKNPQDPYARPNQKKQGRERKAKARNDPSWEPRSGKRRISPPKKHTPGRDHRHFFVFLVWLWNFFE